MAGPFSSDAGRLRMATFRLPIKKDASYSAEGRTHCREQRNAYVAMSCLIQTQCHVRNNNLTKSLAESCCQYAAITCLDRAGRDVYDVIRYFIRAG